MTPQQIMVDVAIANWKLTIKRATGLFDELTDEQFLQHIAPGRKFDPGAGFDWRLLREQLAWGAEGFPDTATIAR